MIKLHLGWYFVLLSLVAWVGQAAKALPHDIAAKYFVPNSGFMTPRSHPNMFSFTGRWKLRRGVYQASQWPGTSFKFLLFGHSCKLKLKCPFNKGTVRNHVVYLKISNDHPLILHLPDYEAEKHNTFDLILTIPRLDDSINVYEEPREVEVISDSKFPILLLGVYTDNVLVSRNEKWIESQNHIPTIEYISDFLPEGIPLNKTSNYKAIRALQLRASFAVDDELCFTSQCKKKSAGLAEAYTFFSPFHGLQKPQDAKFPMPVYYVFNPSPFDYRTKQPDAVIVDVGSTDLAKSVDKSIYFLEIQQFLAQLITNYRPTAMIFVLIKKNRYVEETENAITSLSHLGNKIIAVKFGSNTQDWWKWFYCTYVLSAHPDYSACRIIRERLPMVKIIMWSLLGCLICLIGYSARRLWLNTVKNVYEKVHYYFENQSYTLLRSKSSDKESFD